MQQRVLYLGDTSLDCQAGYLASVMSAYQQCFDYVNSSQKCPDSLLAKDYSAMIVSDYPAGNFSVEQMNLIRETVRGGMGLFMIGGWESFTGDGGDYERTSLAEVLPIQMKKTDDRVNFYGPCLAICQADHEITRGLPFKTQTPAIGGLNKVTVRTESETVLSAVEYHARYENGSVQFKEAARYPLLVLGHYGQGRTVAFTSDVAPHWVGPLVDWGSERLKARADGSKGVEVGNWYASFFMNIITWLCTSNCEKDQII